jgi:hypothetical protein
MYLGTCYSNLFYPSFSISFLASNELQYTLNIDVYVYTSV